MKIFLIKCFIITTCILNTTIQAEYELINENIRFNKENGDIEYFVHLDEKNYYEKDGDTYRGLWMKKQLFSETSAKYVRMKHAEYNKDL